jgi:hypothetical protein
MKNYRIFKGKQRLERLNKGPWIPIFNIIFQIEWLLAKTGMKTNNIIGFSIDKDLEFPLFCYLIKRESLPYMKERSWLVSCVYTMLAFSSTKHKLGWKKWFNIFRSYGISRPEWSFVYNRFRCLEGLFLQNSRLTCFNHYF